MVEIVIRDLTHQTSPIILRKRPCDHECRILNLSPVPRPGEGEDRPAVFLWKLNNPSQPHMLTGLLGGVTSIAFSPDGRLLAICSGYERGVRLWDFRSGRLLRTTARRCFGSMAAAFSPDRTTLASVGGDGKARLWSVNSGELLAVLDGRTMGLAHVAFSADGQTLIAAGPFDNDLRIWQLTLPPRAERTELADAHDVGRSFAVNPVDFSIECPRSSSHILP